MIRELRKQKGWTQLELSKRSGVRQGVLSDIESGKTKHPRCDTLAAIAAALEVPVEQLMKKAG